MAGIPLRTLAFMAEDGDGQADILCSRLEARYDTYDHERRMVEYLMAHPAHDGRPTQTQHAASVSVNGQETRGAERWQGTPRAACVGANGRTIDQTCYRLVPPASGIGPVARVPFNPPTETTETDRPARKRTTVEDAGTDYWRLVRLVGVDTSLAEDDN